MPITEYSAGDGAALADAVDAAPADALPATEVPADQFAHLALNLVIPSRTNPRQHFDEKKLQELADSIKASGVHQPVLVRPLPASVMSTFAYPFPSPMPKWQIVSGERRYRAIKMAGLSTLPAMIRTLTDAQVLEIQLVENLQRDDLTPLEEAAGYERLVRETGIAKEEIGARIGRSRGYVYGRLKLLDLLQDGRTALNEGKLDPSRAEKIARIPDHKLQAKALEFALQEDYQGDLMYSYREFVEWVQKEVMLPLDKARFKITAEDLVPHAGSCRTCEKRTGANPDLFSDVKGADVCTDPTCFHAKEEAHDAAIVAQAAERGQKVIVGKEAMKVSPHDFYERAGKLEGYMRLDKADDRTGSKKSLKKLLGDDCPDTVLLQSPHTGELIEVIPKAKANELLKEKGLIDSRQARAERAISKEERQQEEEEKFERQWRLAAIEEIHGAMRAQPEGPQGPTAPVARCIAKMLLSNLAQDERAHVAKLLELGKVANRDGIEEYIDSCAAEDITRVMLLILMEHDTRNVFVHYPKRAAVTPARIVAVAGAVQVDLQPVQKTVREELEAAQIAAVAKERAKAEAAAKKAKPAPKPAAKASAAPGIKYRGPNGETWTGPGLQPRWMKAALESGKTLADLEALATAKPARSTARKTTKAEAQEGIAAALQSIEPAAAPGGLVVGAKVRFKQALKSSGGKLRKVSGREGKIVTVLAGGGYQVRFGKKTHERAIAEARELELVEGIAK